MLILIQTRLYTKFIAYTKTPSDSLSPSSLVCDLVPDPAVSAGSSQNSALSAAAWHAVHAPQSDHPPFTGTRTGRNSGCEYYFVGFARLVGFARAYITGTCLSMLSRARVTRAQGAEKC